MCLMVFAPWSSSVAGAIALQPNQKHALLPSDDIFALVLPVGLGQQGRLGQDSLAIFFLLFINFCC